MPEIDQIRILRSRRRSLAAPWEEKNIGGGRVPVASAGFGKGSERLGNVRCYLPSIFKTRLDDDVRLIASSEREREGTYRESRPHQLPDIRIAGQSELGFRCEIGQKTVAYEADQSGPRWTMSAQRI